MTDEPQDLRFNVLNHVNVPLHEVVPEDDVPALLKQYNIKLDQLPKIRSNDPGAQVVKAEPGQVVKVTRDSPTAGTHVAYRLVVQAI